MPDQGDLRYPPGADRSALEAGHARTIEELERRFTAASEDSQRDWELKARTLEASLTLLGGGPPQADEAVAAQFAAARDYVRGIRPTRSRPPAGHNPARYPPYDFSWTGVSNGGIGTLSIYGPDKSSGEIGADLWSSTAGAGSTGVYVGDWFYSQSEDTWSVLVQASISGVGAVGAAFGYAEAYAGLELFVRDHGSGATYSAVTDVYNKSADGFGFDVTRFNKYVATVTSVPVHANTWYEVWAGAVQNVYAAGLVADAVSNYAMWVSPIAAGPLVIF